MAPAKKGMPMALIASAFQKVAVMPQYQNQWLCDEKWLEIMYFHHPSMKDALLDRVKFAKAINCFYKHTSDVFDPPDNTSGIFRHILKQISCPMKPIPGKLRNVFFYYATKPGNCVKRPREDKGEFEAKYPQDLVPRNPPQMRAAAKRPPDTEIEDQVAKRQQNAEIPEYLRCYWYSKNAFALFAPQEFVLGRSVEPILRNRVCVRRSVNIEFDGWRKIVQTHDVSNSCNERDIFLLRQKCLLLCRAYEIALDKMNEIRWNECCDQAVRELNKCGICVVTCGRTLERWNKSFPTWAPSITQSYNTF